MFIALMESETCTWISKGDTAQDAKKALLKEWNKRQDTMKRYDKKHGVINDYYKYATPEELEDYYGINIIDFSKTNCEVW